MTQSIIIQNLINAILKEKLKLWKFIHCSSGLQTHKGGKNLMWSRFLFTLPLDFLCSGYSHLPGTRLDLFFSVPHAFSPDVMRTRCQVFL